MASTYNNRMSVHALVLGIEVGNMGDLRNHCLGGLYLCFFTMEWFMLAFSSKSESMGTFSGEAKRAGYETKAGALLSSSRA